VAINQAILNEPNTLVSTSWAKSPTPIAMAPRARLRGFKRRIRPPYSPILLGVNIAQVRPQKTDFIAFHQLMTSTRRLRYFHLTAAIAQFINIITTTIASVPRTVHGSIRSNSDLNSYRFSWLLTLEIMNHVANPTMNNLIPRFRYFFCCLVNYL